jgi:hypothetical protein
MKLAVKGMSRKVILLTMTVLLCASAICFCEEIKLTTIMPGSGSTTTQRTKHIAVGNTYYDPNVLPDSNFTDSPDRDALIEGSVGIGTNAPAYKLDVVGDVNARGYRVNGTSGISTAFIVWGKTAGYLQIIVTNGLITQVNNVGYAN